MPRACCPMGLLSQSPPGKHSLTCPSPWPLCFQPSLSRVCFPYSVMPTEQMSKPPALRGSCQEWDTSTPFRQTPKLEKAFPWKSTPTAFVGTTLPLWAEEGKPQPALQGWPHCTPVGLHATSSHSACFLSGRPGKGKASGRVQPFP